MSADPTWYLGPEGQLRGLLCPEQDVKRPVARYGGTHRALSGAPTLDITGYRGSWELSIPWLPPDQARFLDALHTRTVPGPFRLIDPLVANLLARPAALLTPTSPAVTVDGGAQLVTTTDTPDVGVPVSALDWSNLDAGQLLALAGVPALPATPLVFSVWARSDIGQDLELALTARDGAGAAATLQLATITTTTTWDRYSVTATPPPGTHTIEASVTSVAGGRVLLAAAQVERGNTPTPWVPGGGAPRVLLDSLDRASPRYPQTDLTVTLLEV